MDGFALSWVLILVLWKVFTMCPLEWPIVFNSLPLFLGWGLLDKTLILKFYSIPKP